MSSQDRPYTPFKLVPDWADKIKATPSVDRVELEPSPVINAPRARAAMIPALPRSFQVKRFNNQRRRSPRRQPSPLSNSLMAYQVETPTRQKLKPVIASNIEVVPEETDDADQKLEEQMILESSTESKLLWGPASSKEFVPRHSIPAQGRKGDLEVAGIDSRDWAVGTGQFGHDDQHIMHSSQDARSTLFDPAPGKPEYLSSVPSMPEIDTFAYSTEQREADYRLLFKDSLTDTSASESNLSCAPTFNQWVPWRDEYLEQYFDVFESLYRGFNAELRDAFTVVWSKGFNIKAEGLDEVRKMVLLGHDYSERGVAKFNERIGVLTRNEMMRRAGVATRIELPKKWWYSESEGQ